MMNKIMMILVLMVVSSSATANVHKHIEKMRYLDQQNAQEDIHKNQNKVYANLKAFHQRNTDSTVTSVNEMTKVEESAVRPSKFRG